MKLAIWIVTGVLALLWTLGAWALAALFGWVAGQATPGDPVELARVLTSWPIPAWVTAWIDPAALHAALAGIVWAVEELQRGWPWVSAALAWLVPAVWVAWGCGLVMLLVLAAFAQWLAGLLRSAPPAAAAA
ncbi:MAG: hypothetical protein KF788_06205 [Piscinibacter sp.]|nr:hypothetical protein [Piscinibacter sp.]